jgi:hypothetical protein
MNLSIGKLLPVLVGLVVLGGGATWWLNEVISLSFRTDGTMFSKYAPIQTPVKNPAPSQIGFCDPANKTRWSGCTIGAKN